MGVPSIFIRLPGCNLMCGGQGTQHDGELHNGATWRCDTVEVWMQSQKISTEVITKLSELYPTAHIVITGGEPLLQTYALDKIFELTFGHYIEIETNGTIKPSADQLEHVDQWNVSPKLSNSGNPKSLRYNIDTLNLLNDYETQFKFVVSGHDDIAEIQADFDFLNKNKIYLMPAGESQEQLSETKLFAAEQAMKHGYNFTTRLHIDLWNKKTGV